MFFRKTFSFSAFAVSAAVSFWASAPAMSGEPPLRKESGARYLPIESISYEVGSKVMSGYFVQQGSVCLVTLMIIEKGDPDRLSPATAARVRIMLDPGQIAGLDSEEGRSVNLTCGEGATSLLVDVGERDRLVELQRLTSRKTAAE